MKALYQFVYRYRNIFASAPLILAFFSTTWEWENDWGVWSFSILFCGFGICLRTWSVCHCKYGQGSKKELATTGPYAYVRNPLYLGNMAIIAAAAFASKLLWVVPVTLSWAFIVYLGAVAHEETRLYAKYGEAFMEYKALVPAWIPDFSRLLRVQNRFMRALLRQSAALMVLLPFVVKEFVLDI